MLTANDRFRILQRTYSSQRHLKPCLKAQDTLNDSISTQAASAPSGLCCGMQIAGMAGMVGVCLWLVVPSYQATNSYQASYTASFGPIGPTQSCGLLQTLADSGTLRLCLVSCLCLLSATV